MLLTPKRKIIIGITWMMRESVEYSYMRYSTKMLIYYSIRGSDLIDLLNIYKCYKYRNVNKVLIINLKWIFNVKVFISF